MNQQEQSRVRDNVQRLIESYEWNIKDAIEALQCSVSMGGWQNVIKYAEQLKVLECKLYAARALINTHVNLQGIAYETIRREAERFGSPSNDNNNLNERNGRRADELSIATSTSPFFSCQTFLCARNYAFRDCSLSH